MELCHRSGLRFRPCGYSWPQRLETDLVQEHEEPTGQPAPRHEARWFSAGYGAGRA